MTISQKTIRTAAQRALRGERPDYSGVPPKLRAILEKGFTAEQINGYYRASKHREFKLETSKV